MTPCVSSPPPKILSGILYAFSSFQGLVLSACPSFHLIDSSSISVALPIYAAHIVHISTYNFRLIYEQGVQYL